MIDLPTPPAFKWPAGATPSLIDHYHKKLTDHVTTLVDGWPVRPKAQLLIQKLRDLRIPDTNGGNWKVIEDVFDLPPTCPACDLPPQFGVLKLKHESGAIATMCGACAEQLVGKGNPSYGIIRAYWWSVGQQRRAFPDWMPLIVAATVWLHLHNDYKVLAGSAYEHWAQVKEFRDRYMKFGMLDTVKANQLALIVSGYTLPVDAGEWNLVRNFTKQVTHPTPEEGMLATLLLPDNFEKMWPERQRRVIDIWRHVDGGEKLNRVERRQISITARWIKRSNVWLESRRVIYARRNRRAFLTGSPIRGEL